MTQEAQDDLSALSTKIAHTPDTGESVHQAMEWVIQRLDSLAIGLDSNHAKAVEQVRDLATVFKNNRSTLVRAIVARPDQASEAELAAERAAEEAEVTAAVAKVRAEHAEKHKKAEHERQSHRQEAPTSEQMAREADLSASHSGYRPDLKHDLTAAEKQAELDANAAQLPSKPLRN